MRAGGEPRPRRAARARGRASSWRPPQCVVFSGGARRARGRAKRRRRRRLGGSRGGRCGARSRAAAAARGVRSVSARGRGGGAAHGGGAWRRRRSAFEPGLGSEARSPPTGKWDPAWREERAARGSAGGAFPGRVMAAGGKGGRAGSRRAVRAGERAAPGAGRLCLGSSRAARPSAAPRPSPLLPCPALPAAASRLAPAPGAPGPAGPRRESVPRGRGEGGEGPPHRPARPPRAREAGLAGGGALRAPRPGAGLCCEGSRGVRPTWRRSAECGQWPALPSGPSPHRPAARDRTGRLGRPWPPRPAPDPGAAVPHCTASFLRLRPEPSLCGGKNAASSPVYVVRRDRVNGLPGKLQRLIVNLSFPGLHFPGSLGPFRDSPRFIM